MHFNRRSFLKTAGLSVFAVPLLSTLFSAPPAQAADLPMAKESDSVPKALKYCANADKPTAQCAERKKKEKKNQFCHNCQLYTSLDKEKGKCMVIAGMTVSHHAWCNSWVKKPGT